MSLSETWNYYQEFQNPSIPSLTIPSPDHDISHVITRIMSYLFVSGSGIWGPAVTVSDGATTLWQRNHVANAPAGEIDSVTIDDSVFIVVSPGFGFTLAWNAIVPVSGLGYLQVDGYDI